MTQQYRILFGAVGSLLGIVESRLRNGDTDAEVIDIEDRIKLDDDIRRRVKKADLINPPQTLTMQHVVENLPRDEVCNVWREHCRKAVQDLHESKKKLKILAGHLVYYNSRRTEYYSAVDLGVFRCIDGFTPHTVTVLIDDIYDTYLRLRDREWLFCDESLRSYVEERCMAAGRDAQKLDADENRFLVFTWKMNCLLGLLSWRSHELLMAESLARELGADFLPLALKQPFEVLKRRLEADNPRAVYVSHAITEPRREHAGTGEWPVSVKEINELRDVLLEQDIIAILPTSIDEMRLEGQSNIMGITGRLTQRWPADSDPGSSGLMYELPKSCQDYDHINLLRPIEAWDSTQKRLKMDSAKSDLLDRIVESQGVLLSTAIAGQVSSRDHLYVAHSDGLLVYRPFSGGADRFSSGVRAELDHWAELARERGPGPLPRAAIVHFDEDVSSIVNLHKQSIQRSTGKELVDRLIEDGRFGRDQIEDFVFTGRFPSPSLLDKRRIDKDGLIEKCNKDKRIIKTKVLRDYLSGGVQDIEPKLLGIWVVRSFADLRDLAPELNSFFLGSRDAKEVWRQRIDEFLSDDFIGIHTFPPRQGSDCPP